jgi:uncharacterized membrane protein
VTALRLGSLIAATISAGLIAGLFFAFACAVMPGLHRTEDRSFVDAMQRINQAILNGWFGLCFGGAIVFAVVAAGLHFRGEAKSAFPWILAASVLYLVMLIVTMAVNVPLNDRLEAAGRVGRITDLAAVRSGFETSWVRWNLVRTVASIASFGCLIWALVLHGRHS